LATPTADRPGQPFSLRLEELAQAEPLPSRLPWSHELLLLAADSPPALAALLMALGQTLAQPPPTTLSQLAWQAAQRGQPQGAYRVALVAGSLAELDRQRRRLLAGLGAAATSGAALMATLHQPPSGLFCGFGPPADGTTAFLFPGLGAAYPQMLGDLCRHFPSVRQVFDNLDSIAATLGEPTPPSQQVFPRPSWPKAAPVPERSDGGGAAAVITLVMVEWALAELLRELGIRPEVLMGCSTGEFAALGQGGAIDAVAAVPLFYRLSLAVARALPAGQLAALRSLLTTAPLATLKPLLAAAPGPLYISADLGPGCVLLVGEQPAVRWLADTLEQRQLTAQLLPTGVPYHTPLISSALRQSAAELGSLKISPPTMPIWSCATSRPYPTAAPAILADASALFVRAIALGDTVEAMYQSGVRTFIEVGPGDGLLRRVAAILGQRPFVALASNVQQRSGLDQLLRLLGALHAQGQPLDLAPLFRHRRPPSPLPQPTAAPPMTRPTGSRRPERIGHTLPALTLPLPQADRFSALRIWRGDLPRVPSPDLLDAIFSPDELAQLLAKGRPPAWDPPLLGALATKRALQQLLLRLCRARLTLPELALRPDAAGRLRATGGFTAVIGGEPATAAATTADWTLAVVATADCQVDLGVAIQPLPATATAAQLLTLAQQGAGRAIGQALGSRTAPAAHTLRTLTLSGQLLILAVEPRP
jgi:acyl transferase domain-containing protein